MATSGPFHWFGGVTLTCLPVGLAPHERGSIIITSNQNSTIIA
jgi:hypothetical protein